MEKEQVILNPKDLCNVFKVWREQYPDAEGFTVADEKAMRELREEWMPADALWLFEHE